MYGVLPGDSMAIRYILSQSIKIITDLMHPTSYRVISLTTICCKIIEISHIEHLIEPAIACMHGSVALDRVFPVKASFVEDILPD